jgi:ABC-2 type transport system ATP-binding protein
VNGRSAGDTAAIEVRGLRKSYGEHVVLDGIDFEVAAGTVFALLGPNGAGKTTTVQILSTLIPADGGEVRVAGHDVANNADDVRHAIGVTGQVSAVDGLFTGAENLRLMASLLHLGRAEASAKVQGLLEQFELVDAADKPASTYSGGMRRRLDLAMTLMGDPQIIFLDEPTTGLDPRSRRTMWQIVRELVSRGVTILLTTQYLEEADRLAGRIALLDEGKIIASGTPGELKRLVSGGSVRLQFPDEQELDRAARALGGTRDEESFALRVSSATDTRSLRSLLDQLDREHIHVDGLSTEAADLDDVFLALTSGEARRSRAAQSPEGATQANERITVQ